MQMRSLQYYILTYSRVISLKIFGPQFFVFFLLPLCGMMQEQVRGVFVENIMQMWTQELEVHTQPKMGILKSLNQIH